MGDAVLVAQKLHHIFQNRDEELWIDKYDVFEARSRQLLVGAVSYGLFGGS
jgi:hypothetical protein